MPKETGIAACPFRRHIKLKTGQCCPGRSLYRLLRTASDDAHPWSFDRAGNRNVDLRCVRQIDSWNTYVHLRD